MRTDSRAIAGVVVALSVVMPRVHVAHAQAPAVTDVKQVLKKVADGLGMLRSVREEDSLMTVEFWGSGTMNEIGTAAAPGRAYKVTKYYGAVAYDFPGMRLDIMRTADGTAPQREIQVVSGAFAWNEDQPGAGLVPGRGSAVPAMDAVNDRLLRLWTTPFGIYKAAAAAGANAKVTNEGGRLVLTFPLTQAGIQGPTSNVVVGALGGTPVKVTLNAQYRPERVEVRYGGRMIETTYSDYGDLNDKDTKADIFFPARIVQTVDGRPALALTIEKTNTYNPYVILPVPENVEKAGAGRAR